MTSRSGYDRQTVLVVTGAICWLLTLLYFVMQPIVAMAWEPAYRITANTISDLGNVSCRVGERPKGYPVYICSPRHSLMNAAFIAVGLLTVAGALLTRPAWPARSLVTVGLTFVALAGAGGVLVGLAPADVNTALHVAGATLQVPGAVAPLLLGVSRWRERRAEAVFSLTCGAVGTVASLLLLSQVRTGLGMGGMQRLAFSPLTLWTGVLAATILYRSLRAGQATVKS